MRKPAGYNEIGTERLLLRTPLETDAAIVKTFGGGEFKNNRHARKWIRGVHKSIGRKTLFMFYIWLAETGQHLGRVYIYSKPEIDYEFEVAYGIYEEHRCKGYATEAARAAIRFAFGQGGREELCAIVKPENAASQRVIAKLGFTRCGTRMVLCDDGENCELDYFRLYRQNETQ